MDPSCTVTHRPGSAAQRACPVHGVGQRPSLPALPTMKANPAQPTLAEAMPGFRNVGLVVEDMGGLEPGRASREWAGTEFEACTFPHGISATDDAFALRISIDRCLIRTRASLGAKSTITDSQVQGDLELSHATAERVEVVGGALQLFDGARVRDVKVSHVFIKGGHAEFFSNLSTEVLFATAAAARTSVVHLGNGGVIVPLAPAVLVAMHERTYGDEDLIAISASVSPKDVALARVQHQAAVMFERGHPAWISTRNDGAWEHLVDTGVIDRRSPSISSLTETDAMLATALHPNP